MQDLTAHYNILFNAKVLFEKSKAKVEGAYTDNDPELISVYKEPNKYISLAEGSQLDSVILKANLILKEKPYSRYKSQAYMLIGKANFYKANFYDAVEFFKYINFCEASQAALRQEALFWLSRALLLLNNLEEAHKSLDTAFMYAASAPKLRAGLYALRAELSIKEGYEAQAMPFLKKAIEYSTIKPDKLRWRFLLAQIQEKHAQTKEAIANYLAIMRSNAPYIMEFYAQLHKIALEKQESPKRIQSLRFLLKKNKNIELKSRIYYQIGQEYIEDGNVKAAIDAFNISISSAADIQEKMNAYYALAELYLKQGNYLKSKEYYSKILSHIDLEDPRRKQAALKSKSLDTLANNYLAIAYQDTLQALSKLNKQEQVIHIAALVKQDVITLAAERDMRENIAQEKIFKKALAIKSQKEERFCFDNPDVVSQGINTFKVRWGNRSLKDNWRINARNLPETKRIPFTSTNDVREPEVLNKDLDEKTLNERWLRNIPITEQQLKLSNQKIIDAYYAIANTYKNELDDQQSAIQTYEKLLERYPQNDYKAPTLYALCLLYRPSDSAKSIHYQNLLLQGYPNSSFARILQRPAYLNVEEYDDEENLVYNKVYELYKKESYQGVIREFALANKQWVKKSVLVKLAYLKALALGHLQPMDSLTAAFQEIIQCFPNDRHITPIVKKQLAYIKTNHSSFKNRVVALEVGSKKKALWKEDPTFFFPDERGSLMSNFSGNLESERVKKPFTTAIKKDTSAYHMHNFSLPPLAEYYFVVNVNDPFKNLNPFRFEIGQFNRSYFPNVKHQLKIVDHSSQLVYIGPFSSLVEVREYQKNIKPRLEGIMQVYPCKYGTFVISQNGLDQLSNAQLVDDYAKFYKQWDEQKQ